MIWVDTSKIELECISDRVGCVPPASPPSGAIADLGALVRIEQWPGRVEPAFLADRARRGDQDAWAEIYRLAYPRLLSFAQRRLRSSEASRDAVSETMARAVACIDRYQHSDSGLTAWLFGICRNVVAEACRYNQRFRDVEPPEQAADLSDPAQELIAEQDGHSLREAFGQLSAQEQEILELRVVGRVPSDQVGRILGMTPAAVRMAQMRALARLRALVEEGERVS